ncbi:MAG: tyrosine-protein phosphatase, partial [Bacteroidota bacterium]
MIYKKDSTGYDLPVVSIEVAHPLEGAKNFRIPAYSVMPAGRVYRSDALHELTEADIRYLDSLGIKTIIDLRNEEEVADEPDRNIPSVVNLLYFPVRRDKNKNEEIPDSLYSEFRQMFFDQRYDEVARIMDSLGLDIPAGRIERYRSFALNHREAYSKFMKALADSSIYPVVFHCQGGKDRAGFASAILGRTLGATHEEIMQDYLTTNLHNYEGLKQMQKVPPAIKSIIGA